MEQAARTLVFNFDGTGNEPADAGGFKQDESISNVLKLHVLLGGSLGGAEEDAEHAATPVGEQAQPAFYYSGIGTLRKSIPLLGRLFSVVNLAIAPSFGDAQTILDGAEKDLAQAYRPGDRIAIFGYSRGAALARKFASTILAADESLRVAFLGVFDTVAAMGGVHRRGEKISSDVVFENGTLNPRVDKAVHAVSIDEDRVPFTPTLMNRDASNPGRIAEVWFPGVHGDVGGGYWVDGLSDSALDFMLGQCRAALGRNIAIAGAAPSPAALKARGIEHLAEDDVALDPRPDAPIHYHDGTSAAFLDQDASTIQVCDNDEPCDDLPTLHYSVKQRLERVADYRPSALRDLRFRLWLGEGALSEPIHGLSGLRRYAMPRGWLPGWERSRWRRLLSGRF